MAGRDLFADQPIVEAAATGRDLFIDAPPQVQARSQQLQPEPFKAKEPEQRGIAGDVGQSLLQGATLGFADEIQSVIAAAVAAPFVSDKTFGQLMIDARASFREEQERFREESPKLALGLEVAGGLATGGVLGAGKQIAKQTFAKTVATGAGVGAVAGAGFADEDKLLGIETAKEAGITALAGVAFSVLTPIAIKAAVSAGKLIPKEVPRKLLETALKFRPGIKTRDRTKMTNTALKEGILPTVRGLGLITKKVDLLDENINKIIDTATERGVLISKKALFTQLKKLRTELGGAKLDAGTDLNHIDAVVKAFDEQLKRIKKTQLTPREVQTLKQDAYKRINFDLMQGKASFAKNEARKSIARAAKESIETIDPSIQRSNQRMGDLLQLNEELERVVSRLDNRNLISIDTAVKIGAGAATGTATGVVLGTGASVLGSPRIKARTALMLENLRILSETKGVIGKLPVQLSTPLSVIVARETDAIKDQINQLSDSDE